MSEKTVKIRGATKKPGWLTKIMGCLSSPGPLSVCVGVVACFLGLVIAYMFLMLLK